MHVIDPRTNRPVLITRENVKQYFPFFGCHDHDLDNMLYKYGKGGVYCPFGMDCIKETNRWRREQKELLNLDRARLIRQNMSREERMREAGFIRPDAKRLSREDGFDLIGYMERIRRERGRGKKDRESNV